GACGDLPPAPGCAALPRLLRRPPRLPGGPSSAAASASPISSRRSAGCGAATRAGGCSSSWIISTTHPRSSALPALPGPPAHHAGLHGDRRLVDEPHRGAVWGPQALHPHGHGRPDPRRAPAADLPLTALPPPATRADRSSAHAPALASPHQVGGALGVTCLW